MEILKKLAVAVCGMEVEETARLTEQALAENINALKILNEGLIKGMDEASRLFEEEYFVPELLICSDAMYAGLEILKPHLEKSHGAKKGKIVIGVVAGDTHDIGKNIVKLMLETANFEIIDLGRNVPLQAFVDKAVEVGADMICLSTLMTTTMGGMEKVIDILAQRGLRDNIKVIVGGGPLSLSFLTGPISLASSLLEPMIFYKELRTKNMANAISFDSVTSVRQVAGTVHDKAIMGNVSTYALEIAGPEKVRIISNNCLANGVNILSPACGIGPRTPLENIKAMVAAARAYGERCIVNG